MSGTPKTDSRESSAPRGRSAARQGPARKSSRGKGWVAFAGVVVALAAWRMMSGPDAPSDATPRPRRASNETHPRSPEALAVEMHGKVPAPASESANSRIMGESTTLESGVAPIPRRGTRPLDGDRLELPAAAVPPGPELALNAEQLAEYTKMGWQFLQGTQDPTAPGRPATTQDTQKQWASAVEASNAQFEQFFGTEVLSAQRLRAQVNSLRQ